jgi:hypothetical protein
MRRTETIKANDAVHYEQIMASREAERIAAFARDSQAFPVGTKVTTSWGQCGVVVAEKGRVETGLRLSI